MSDINYPEPLSRLVTLGEPDSPWPDYPALYGLTQEHKYDGHSFPFQQNLLTEPFRPACEKPNLAFGDSRPERDGFITCRAILQPLRHDLFLLPPRSPPVSLPL